MKNVLPGTLLLLAFFSLAAHVSGQNLAITSTSPLPPGTVGTAYSFQFTASGANGNSLIWHTPSGTPPGLTMDQNTGILSGTPASAVSDFPFDVTVAYTNGEQSTPPTPFTFTATSITNPGPQITSSATLTTAEQNVPYSFTFTASGGNGQYFWSVVSGSLPAGLSLSSNGVLTGSATTIGRYFFGVQVLSNDQTANQSVSLRVVAPVQVSSASPLPAADLGSPYSFSFQAFGGQAPYTWGLGSGVPPGLSINSGGILFGTPTTTGTFTFDATVFDGLGGTNTKTFQITVNPTLAITSNSPLPAGETSAAYSFQFIGTGGAGSYTWSVAPETNLPAGLTLSSGGLLSGTPTTPQSASFGIILRDSAGGTATKSFQVQIGAGPAITSSSPLPAGTVASPYTFTFLASGGSGAKTWAVSSGSLPAGLLLSASTGVLSGTPSSAGTSNFVVAVHDSAGGTASGSFALTIYNSLTITSPSPLPTGEVTRPYTFTFNGSGGSGSYTWSVPSGSVLPSGLTLSAAGNLSGMPTSAGTTSFSIQIGDGIGNSFTKAFQLQVVAAPSITTTSPLPAGSVNTAYGPLTFSESGGIAPFQWSSSQLPAGLSFSSSGVLSGAPTSTGTSSFSVTLTDAAGGTASGAFSLSVFSQLTIASGSPLPAGAVNSPYSFTFQAGGGSGSYAWSVASGALPNGLSLNASSGTLSGTPTTIGNSSFTIGVTDLQRDNTASKTFSLTINSSLSITSASPLPTGEVSRPYSFTFTGGGGSGSYSWSVASGSTLPPGLTLNSGGLLSGTPTPPAAGTNSFSVQIADGAGNTAIKAFQLQILAAPSITTTSPLAPGTVNIAYGPLTFTGSGGTAPFQWSSSQLPAGLSLSSSGVLSGTPTSGGTSSFSVTLTDAAGATASGTFSLNIISQLTITSGSPLPNATVGSAYSFTFQGSGGSGSYSWSITSGPLPAGLSLNSSSGLLSGRPTGAGNSTFVVQLSDVQRENQTSKTFSIVVATAVAPLRITSPAALTGQLGTNYSFMFTATGGAPPYTWSLNNGVLPSGLALASTGVLSGKPSGVGPFSFTIQVADNLDNSATQAIQLQFTLPTAPPLQITGIPTNPPANSQPTFQITIPNAFSFDIQGVLTLTFSSPSGINDPAVQFTNGTRNLAFTIPAGSTTAVYTTGESPVFLTGTIAGTITLTTTQYQALGLSLTPVPPPVQVVVPPTAPIITSVTATHGAGGFTVTVIGYSPTRDVTAGTFSFLGSNLDTPQLHLDLTALFQGWYGNVISDQFGSQFKLTQPFNLNGGSGNVKTVSVTLTNSFGTSQLVTAQVE